MAMASSSISSGLLLRVCAAQVTLNSSSTKVQPTATKLSSRNTAGSLVSSFVPSTATYKLSYLPRSSSFDPLRLLSGVARRYNGGRHWQSRRGISGRVHASLLGVGAPEALVIAVVALVVFGPKGLAEVARTLGKSLKAFQPTIQELQQVSREFRSTLEQEIGLDELRNPKPTDTRPTYKQESPVEPRLQNGAPETRAYTTEDYVRVTEEQAKPLVAENLRREQVVPSFGGSHPTGTPAENGTERADRADIER